MPNYQGHSAKHPALQNHSVGDIYPWAIVAYDNGGELAFTLENLAEGKCATDRNGSLFVWRETANALRFALWHLRGIRAPEDEAILFTHSPKWREGRPIFIAGELNLPVTVPKGIFVQPAPPLTPYQEYQRAMELDNA